MFDGRFRFAAALSVALAAVAVMVALAYDLPLRDPDGVQIPTYVRLPVILLAAWFTDVLPRTLWRSRSLRGLPATFRTVVTTRWPWAQARFALVGLGAWYLTYVAFRNLKSYVPFVNRRLFDDTLDRLDRILWLGHDPAAVLHGLFGTGAAAHVFSFIYVAWIVFVPFSLVVALVWSRDARRGEWYVTAVAVDWVLGVATYFAVPTLGPVYAQPEEFAGLSHTYVSSLQELMLDERRQVLFDPFGTQAVQTIAAFASLHVGIMVTVCLMCALLDLPALVRGFMWAFLALTVVATVYLGWHYFVDALGGAAIGAAAVWIAALGTGNHVRGRPVLVTSEPAVQSTAESRSA